MNEKQIELLIAELKDRGYDFHWYEPEERERNEKAYGPSLWPCSFTQPDGWNSEDFDVSSEEQGWRRLAMRHTEWVGLLSKEIEGETLLQFIDTLDDNVDES